MSVLIVIPARYASTRYPGKPLVALKGASGVSKTLIERSWDAAMAVKGVDRVVVATDDLRIQEVATGFGAEVVMTSQGCRNGTERCAEALERISERFDIVVNLQGDAPLTPAHFVQELIAALQKNPWAAVATPVLPADGAMLNNLLDDRKAGRVGGTTAVRKVDGSAMYFSKEVIPFVSKNYANDDKTPVFHHVGVYAYRPDALRAYTTWPMGHLEDLEGLEQLRFLENGEPILCVDVDAYDKKVWELNNPSDVQRIEEMMISMGSG